MGTRGNAVPPKAFSVPSKKISVPAKAISVPAKKTIAFPPKDFAFPPRTLQENVRNFTELHRLPLLEIGPENSFKTTPPLEFTELHRLPPSKSGRKTPSTTPPSNSQNFIIDYPPPPSKSNRAGKLLQLPPLEFTELHRLPLSSPELVERTGTLP